MEKKKVDGVLSWSEPKMLGNFWALQTTIGGSLKTLLEWLG